VFLLLDNIVIRLLDIVIRVSSLWNPKAAQWLKGRKNIMSRIKAAMQGNTRKVIWLHSASLGEFEHGRFLIESFSRRYPDYCVVVTFFSPSGYQVMKDYKGADHVFYLPLPTARNAKKFVDYVNPSLVFWIKYDYWYHYLYELKRRNIPLLLVSAIFYRRHAFFRWYGPLYKRMLHFFTWLFVQDAASERRIRLLGLKNVSVSGDTRFDRVIDIAENFQPVPFIDEFIGDSPVVVAGSTWTEDEEELDHYANTHRDIKFIIAPHEVHNSHVENIEKLFHSCVRYSQLAKGIRKPEANTLIIDNIGMLSRLYNYATIAYIGGGFGQEGVHNVLEAAVFGKPIIFGPVFNQFQEAIELLEEGAAFTVDNALDLEKVMNRLLSSEVMYRECEDAARTYVIRKKGATERILNYIQENRLLMS
jgi:3-deoxy-D-manno-octulosonic-acid transferase